MCHDVISPVPSQLRHSPLCCDPLLGLHSILPHRKVDLPLLVLLRHAARVLLRQPSSDRACLLGSEVEWEVFLALVEVA